MSDTHAHDVNESVRRYLIVFAALLVGTVLTVWASYIHFPHFHVGSVAINMNVAVALFIASVKAFLVAGYFMHLISERKMIYGVLGATGFFFAGLMVLTIWAMHDYPILPAR
jgi:cytochrome c oxidase subunit IV